MKLTSGSQLDPLLYFVLIIASARGRRDWPFRENELVRFFCLASSCGNFTEAVALHYDGDYGPAHEHARHSTGWKGTRRKNITGLDGKGTFIPPLRASGLRGKSLSAREGTLAPL